MKQNDVGQACEPARVEGVKCEWRVDPALLAQPFSEEIERPRARTIHEWERLASRLIFAGPMPPAPWDDR